MWHWRWYCGVIGSSCSARGSQFPLTRARPGCCDATYPRHVVRSPNTACDQVAVALIHALTAVYFHRGFSYQACH